MFFCYCGVYLRIPFIRTTWPKPSFFDYCPSLDKDNMEKIFKRYIFLKISI
jgi:hypothetical protein